MAKQIFASAGKVKGMDREYKLDLNHHCCIAGNTGSGKSFFLKTIISSIIRKMNSKQLTIYAADPKRVELSVFEGIPQMAVYAERIEEIDYMIWEVSRLMESRYDELKKLKLTSCLSTLKPNILVILEEYADIISSQICGKRIQERVCKIAQMGRAAGITLMITTQHPVVKVIDSQIKANMSNRIAFRTATSLNSRVILDAAGAEHLQVGEKILRCPNENKLLHLEPIRVVPNFVRSSVEYAVENERQYARC